jgi:hypothetical protein
MIKNIAFPLKSTCQREKSPHAKFAKNARLSTRQQAIN